MSLPVGLLGVTETEALLQLETEGLRIPLDKNLLAELDFRRPRESILEISIGWRGRLPTGTEAPRMAIVPTASTATLTWTPGWSSKSRPIPIGKRAEAATAMTAPSAAPAH